jgi:hypothetical protein
MYLLAPLRILGLLSSLLPSALLSSGRIGPLCWRIPLLLLFQYSIPACPVAHAVPALVLDVALSEVAEDSIDAPVLSSAVVDALYFFLSIPVYGIWLVSTLRVNHSFHYPRSLFGSFLVRAVPSPWTISVYVCTSLYLEE